MFSDRKIGFLSIHVGHFVCTVKCSLSRRHCSSRMRSAEHFHFHHRIVVLHTHRKRKTPQYLSSLLHGWETIMTSSAKLWPIPLLQCLATSVTCLPPKTIRQMTLEKREGGGCFIHNIQKQSWHGLVTAHHIPAETWLALCLSHPWTPCVCCWCQWHRWSVGKLSCFHSSRGSAPAACTSHGWTPWLRQGPVSCLQVESNEKGSKPWKLGVSLIKTTNGLEFC